MTPDRNIHARGHGRPDRVAVVAVDVIVPDDHRDAARVRARDGAASGIAVIAALLLAVGILLGLHECRGIALLCDSLSLTAVATACGAALANR